MVCLQFIQFNMSTRQYWWNISKTLNFPSVFAAGSSKCYVLWISVHVNTIGYLKGHIKTELHSEKERNKESKESVL